MRFRWLAVVVLLGSVAMYAPIQAENGKRTATMSVRVLVVRPCLVSTAPVVRDVNCQAPGAPAPRMTTTPFQGPLPAAAAGQPPVLPPDTQPVAVTTVTTAGTPITAAVGAAPAAVTSMSADATATDPAVRAEAVPSVANAIGGASPVAGDSRRRPARQLERLRVLTVHF
jgi:hypothetical protein